MRNLPNGESLVDAGMSIEDFNEHFRVDLPDTEFDTVGGYLFGLLEHVPVVGETLEIEGWRFVVEALEGRRITEVRLMPIIGTE